MEFDPLATGLFLSLDGPDGAGKSTQCRLLVEWLRAGGWTVTACRDPGGTPVGDRIRELLLDRQSVMNVRCEALLYAASRAQLVADVIQPALVRGDVVVADRFVLANVVYQGRAGGLPPEAVWEASRLATGGLLPDLTIVLDVPTAIGASRRRGQPDRIESRGPAYHQAVREGFLLEARLAPDRHVVIDASRAVEAVHEDVRKEVARVLAKRSRP